MTTLPLEGQVAVITGGTRGLGLAIAQTYARAGAAVVVASRSRASVETAVRALRTAGARATGLACDVSDEQQVQAVAAHALSTFGRLTLWVNNAGLGAPYGPTAHVPPDAFRRVIDTNILGVYHGSLTALQHFLPQRRGKLINLVGRGETGAVPLQNAYSSSKVWVRQFTGALAREYRTSGVGIFSFNPGLVTTEMLSQPQAIQGYEQQMRPLQWVVELWGNPPEVAAQRALWLASSATDGRTGLAENVLGPGAMLAGVVRAGWSKAPVTLTIETVPPALPVE